MRDVPVHEIGKYEESRHYFRPGDLVHITELVAGVQARYCYRDGQMRTGSQRDWEKGARAPQRRVLKWHPEIVNFCGHNQDCVLYCVAYPDGRRLRYSVPAGECRLAVFDIYRGRDWLAPMEARKLSAGLPWVPVIADGLAYSDQQAEWAADGRTKLGERSHMRKGAVVRHCVVKHDTRHRVIQCRILSEAYKSKRLDY